jgi:Ferredoxin-like domain in Api92-like protein
MPNHITTVCTVTGDDVSVRAFRAAHITVQFDFETIIPMPACVKATIRDWENGEMIGDAEVEYYAKALIENRCCAIPSDQLKHMRLPEHVKRHGDLIDYYDSEKPQVARFGKAALTSAAETGYPGWYEWSCANWGTKWDAYDYEEREVSPGRFVFKFETAWSPPEPIFEKLAEIWPDLVIETESIDEGGGEYVGTFHGEHRELKKVVDDDERYERVYGRPRESYDD